MTSLDATTAINKTYISKGMSHNSNKYYSLIDENVLHQWMFYGGLFGANEW